MKVSDNKQNMGIVSDGCHTMGEMRHRRLNIQKAILLLGITMLFVLMFTQVALAAPPDASELWNTLKTQVETWVGRLGGVVMFVGGIMFGLGWKNDDAEQKSRGISTIIAGAIVLSVSALAGTFFG